MRRRATRIVEWVGLAGAANASYGRPALFEGQKAAIGATELTAAGIVGAPFVWVVWHLIGAGGRWVQDQHQQERRQQRCSAARQVHAFSLLVFQAIDR